MTDNDAILIDAGRHPLSSGHAPAWASGWGQDRDGVFVEISVDDVIQRLRWCPPGRFLMGSPKDEVDRWNDEGPQTEVTFEAGFWLFDTAVSQKLWTAVMGENPSEFKGADRPVEKVRWNDVQTFLERINERRPGLDLRLPSEAEWEYACRAGSATPFEPTVAATHGGEDITSGEVNFDGNHPLDKAVESQYREQTVAVSGAPFRPNKWGLWHMHGNVFEWCADIWSGTHDGADPTGKPRLAESEDESESSRLIRGGSWYDVAGNCRAAVRNGYDPDRPLQRSGFSSCPRSGQHELRQGGRSPLRIRPGGPEKLAALLIA